MPNQTPFEVEVALTPVLVGLASEFAPESIVTVPTMGLGHHHYAAPSLSRKFWYEVDMSESMCTNGNVGSPRRRVELLKESGLFIQAIDGIDPSVTHAVQA